MQNSFPKITFADNKNDCLHISTNYHVSALSSNLVELVSQRKFTQVSSLAGIQNSLPNLVELVSQRKFTQFSSLAGIQNSLPTRFNLQLK